MHAVNLSLITQTGRTQRRLAASAVVYTVTLSNLVLETDDLIMLWHIRNCPIIIIITYHQ